MSKPSDSIRAGLRLTDEERAEIDAKLNDPARGPGKVEWTDAGADPFEMGWNWLKEEDAGDATSRPRDGAGEGPGVLPLAGPRRPRAWTSPALWAAGLAASVAVVASVTWATVNRGGRGMLVERDVAAWVTGQIETGEGGVSIAAPADGNDKEKDPLINKVDRPLDAPRPAISNVYAPLRVQGQLVIPEVPPDVVPRQTAGRPLRSVTETVGPGSLFYLEFSTASTGSPGTAVVVRARPGSWRLLWEEVATSPADGTCYFGPLKMEDDGADYLVILADRASAPLLTTVSRTLGAGGASPPDPEAWKSRLADALRQAGHGWYGVRRIEVHPERVKAPPR